MLKILVENWDKIVWPTGSLLVHFSTRAYKPPSNPNRTPKRMITSTAVIRRIRHKQRYRNHTGTSHNLSIFSLVLAPILTGQHYRIFGRSILSAEAVVTCTDTSECESILRSGSKCSSGVCTNPFHNGGCLALKGITNNIFDDVHKAPVRVCSSNDDPSSAELGFCRPPDLQLGYTEIRILSQNWESSFFSTWIVQVLLSEILGVPTSVETGSPGKSVDFYDIGNAMDYGISNDYKAL